MPRTDLQQWRDQQDNADRPMPWWLRPVSLLWKRAAPVAEQDTVPVPVPTHIETIPMQGWDK